MKRWLLSLLFVALLNVPIFAQLDSVDLPNTFTWDEYSINYPNGWTATEGEDGSATFLSRNSLLVVLVQELRPPFSLEEYLDRSFSLLNSTSVDFDEIVTIEQGEYDVLYYMDVDAPLPLMAVKQLDETTVAAAWLLAFGDDNSIELDETIAILASLQYQDAPVGDTAGSANEDPLASLLGRDDEEPEEQPGSILGGIFGGGNSDDETDAPNTEALSGTPDEICEAATPASDPETREYDEPEEVLEQGVDYQAIFCTDVGAIYIELFEEETPITVNNFVFLAQNGFYNNTIFHRVIEDFMAQGGDPTGTGRGGPGYQFQDEFVDDLVFDRPGLLAMANAGPGTNGSQFFITTVETPWLDGNHTIFGEVIEGQDVVENIDVRDPQVRGSLATILETIVIITDPAQVQ